MNKLHTEYLALSNEKLESACSEILTFYGEKPEELTRAADVAGIPPFSDGLRVILRNLPMKRDAVLLVELASRIGNFRDSDFYTSARKYASRKLKADGVRRPRGKRPNAGLEELVRCLTPLLLHFVLPLNRRELKARLCLAYDCQ